MKVTHTWESLGLPRPRRSDHPELNPIDAAIASKAQAQKALSKLLADKALRDGPGHYSIKERGIVFHPLTYQA